MALQPINVGQAPNDGTGDTFRVAAQKMNASVQALDDADKALGQRLTATETAATAAGTAAQDAKQAATAAGQAAVEVAQQAAQGLATHTNAADPHAQYAQGGTSLGTGLAVFLGKVAGMLRFRSLKAGTGISVTVTGDDLVIAATGGNIGTVTSVNGKAPNGAGAVTLAPADVGALAASSTAVDSAKLGAQLPAYYGKAADVTALSQSLTALTTEVGKKAYTPAGAGPWWIKAGNWVAASLADLSGTIGRARVDATVVPRIAALTKPNAACQDYGSMVVKTADGDLLGWGETTYGLLGNGLTSGLVGPTRPIWQPEIPLGVTVTEFVHCRRAVYALLSNGQVYACGEQASSELGVGDTTQRRFMTRLEYFVNNGITITKVFATAGRLNVAGSAFFLDAAGNVYSCGNNQSGHHGSGGSTHKPLPTQVPGVTGIVDVALNCGQVGTAFLRNAAGELWSAGHNGYGECGQGVSVGGTSLSFVKVPGMSGVTKVMVCGDYHSNGSSYGASALALAGGELYTTGWTGYGISGLGPTASGNRAGFTKIPGLSGVVDFGLWGGYFNAAWAVTNTGRLYVWGHNGQGIIGLGTYGPEDRPTPTQPVGYASISTGYVPVTTGDPPFVGGIVKVETNRTAFGHQQMVLLDTSGRLWFIGHDYCQFVGAPAYVTRWTQIPVPRWVTQGEKVVDFRFYGMDGEYRLFILTDDQNLYVIGSNIAGAATAAVNRTLPVLPSIQKVFP